ncbi:MAG: type II toxin-antitoxin system prevent-host-death family antitoxin [Halanaerobium sp.]
MRVNSTDLQNSFGKYLALVEKEDIIVLKNGKSVAKLSSYHDYRDYLKEEARDYNSANYKRVSYQEYLELVENSDQRYELIDGEVFLMASPSFRHQMLVNEISWHLNNYFRNHNCSSLTSPFDIRLQGYAPKFEEDPNVVQPDLIVICDPENVEDDKYQGVPTLLVEVLSPSTKKRDLILKLNLYLKSGVKEYWIVDPENKKITQYVFTEEREIEAVNDIQQDQVLSSGHFEELKLNLSEIFSKIE